MRKIVPLALILGLGAAALSGNPLENTIIKEENKKESVNFTGSADNKSLSFESSFSLTDNWRLNFASDMQFSDAPRINNVDAAIGNRIFYAGFSYGDLSTESSLQGASIAKLQSGLKPFDWLDFSLTGARINLPHNSVDITPTFSGLSNPLVFNIPLTLYAIGWNANAGKEFSLNDSLTLFPWLSVTGSKYWAIPKRNDDFQSADALVPGQGAESMAYPFDHLHIEGGLDLDINKHFRLSYKGAFEGQPYYPSPFNVTNMAGLRLYDKDKSSLEYDLSLITKPPYTAKDNLINPLRNELQIDFKGFNLFRNGLYLKGDVSALIDFLTPIQFNATAGIGLKLKESGNIELYLNSKFNPENGSQNNVVGIQYSTQLNTSTDREGRTRNDFNNSKRISPTIDYPTSSSSLANLHMQFGNTLEEAIARMHSEDDISRLLSLIEPRDHPDGYFTARQEYEQTGWGDCEDTNGNLGVVLEKALGYKNVYCQGLRGAFNLHAVIIIQTDKGFDIRSFEKYYKLNAPTAQVAISQVFPGAYIFDDGTTSTTAQTVRNAVERPLYDYNATTFTSDDYTVKFK